MDDLDVLIKRDIIIKKLKDELMYVKRERDAAIADITEFAKFYRRRTICDFCKYDCASVEECKARKKDNHFIMEYCSDERVYRTTYILI